MKKEIFDAFLLGFAAHAIIWPVIEALLKKIWFEIEVRGWLD